MLKYFSDLWDSLKLKFASYEPTSQIHQEDSPRIILHLSDQIYIYRGDFSNSIHKSLGMKMYITSFLQNIGKKNPIKWGGYFRWNRNRHLWELGACGRHRTLELIGRTKRTVVLQNNRACSRCAATSPSHLISQTATLNYEQPFYWYHNNRLHTIHMNSNFKNTLSASCKYYNTELWFKPGIKVSVI